jgi:carbonic anhydrase/acetyltransferase-like protein (isoleucine patch superfamily)
MQSNKKYVDKTAVLKGDIVIGENSSVWPNAVLRADFNRIIIGKNTNIQDNVTIHADKHNPVVVGDNVSVGHNAILHGCTVRNNCIIGMGAIVMDGSEICENCIIGAGSLVPPNKEIPPNSVVIGTPGKVVRTTTAEDLKLIKENAKDYVELKEKYLNKV